MKAKVYAFDFDGTLTTRDTLLAFIRYSCGTGRFLCGFLLFLPMLLLMKFRLYPNWKAKQQVFSWYFKDMAIKEFDALCQQFARDNMKLLRPQGLATIRQALSERSRVIIVSASVENWVKPFFEEFGDQIQVSCTRIDVRQDKVTGKFLTHNCYGSEKVKRIKRAFPFRDTYELIAFGDTEGDKAMLAYADKSYYKPFR